MERVDVNRSEGRDQEIPVNAGAEVEETTFKVLDKRFWAQAEDGSVETEQRPSAPSYVEELKQQLEQKDQQLREYIAAYKREVVENLEQTRSRLARDAEQQAKTLRAEVAEPMMEVLDALERSLQAAESHSDIQALRDGLKLVLSLMLQRLGALGLQRIASVGEPFDPRMHEAVGLVPVTDAAQSNRITTELCAGFSMDGRVVRAAKVLVGKYGGES